MIVNYVSCTQSVPVYRSGVGRHENKKKQENIGSKHSSASGTYDEALALAQVEAK